ncbi:MAG TPA: glycosyltransferase family 2 protein [Kiritimatiellia bacterium]|nr:glycosyltransferase family 2 protein [Kiritimatiellia bacterium]
MPRLAIIAPVLNEPRWLRLFVTWHRAAGVERFYFYLDGESPPVRDALAAYPMATVTVEERDRSKEHAALFHSRCMNDAFLRAREEGIDWLLAIDPDEYAWGSTPAHPERFSLSEMLAGVPDHVEEVVLSTLEAQPLASWMERPFWEDLLVIHDRMVEREVLDPLDGSMRRLSRWLGHRLGKSLIRTKVDAFAFNPHRWTRDPTLPIPAMSPFVQMTGGCHLHLPVLHGVQWREKFESFQHHTTYPRGHGMEFPKLSWSQSAATMTDEACKDYFATWLALSSEQVNEAVAGGILSRASEFERKFRELRAWDYMAAEDVCTR